MTTFKLWINASKDAGNHTLRLKDPTGVITDTIWLNLESNASALLYADILRAGFGKVFTEILVDSQDILQGKDGSRRVKSTLEFLLDNAVESLVSVKVPIADATMDRVNARIASLNALPLVTQPSVGVNDASQEVF